MSKDEKNEQFDADIQQCREDVLRLRDIIPGPAAENKADGKNQQAEKTPQAVDKPTLKEIQDSIPIPIKPLSAKEAPKQAQGQIKIPRFDLAEEIMAEHRKRTATTRKGPVQKIEPTVETPIPKPKAAPIHQKISQPQFSQEDKIISEIVARDIERLYRRN